MLRNKLEDYNIILASGSPRRQQLFKELDLEFTIDVRPINEIYSENLKGGSITEALAQLKATAFPDLAQNDLLITSDTIVWKDKRAIGKPTSVEHARTMLKDLSGEMHEVYTSVCFTSLNFQKTITDVTKVWFKELSDAEIDYYISHYKPFDKAGSYGVQDWLGYIAIERLEGSYYNVMGLPTHLVYTALRSLPIP